MPRQLIAWTLVISAPLLAALWRWPVAGAVMALGLLVARWPRKRKAS